jgi:hypothetical protein
LPCITLLSFRFHGEDFANVKQIAGVSLFHQHLKLAAVRFPWNKKALMPTFTGLPPHVCILAQLEGIRKLIG